MLDFREINLDDRRYFRAASGANENSKYSFAQTFAWRKAYRNRICVRESGILFTSQFGSDPFGLVSPILFDPDAPIAPLVEDMIAYFQQLGSSFFLKYVCPQIREKLEREFPGRFAYIPVRDDFEYIYNTRDLIDLTGKKYHGKRNHINAFTHAHPFTFRPYEPSMYDDVMAVQAEWLEGKDRETDEETYAISELLKNYTALELRAGVIDCEGKIISFSIGEKIAAHAAMMIIEKADPGYEGAFQVINREMAKLFSDTEVINRGEDMGIEGLRQSKLTYHPKYLLEKDNCILAEEAHLFPQYASMLTESHT